MSLTPLHLNPRPLSVPRASDGRWYSDGRTSVGASGGTSALSWSAPEGLEHGKPLIIETDGAYDFGSEEPEFLFLIDARKGEDGQFIPIGSVITGPNTTDEGDAEGLRVQSNPDMPGGAALQVGNESDESLNLMNDHNRFRFNFPLTTKVFQSAVWYMPHQPNVQSHFDAFFGEDSDLPADGQSLDDGQMNHGGKMFWAATDGDAYQQDDTDFWVDWIHSRGARYSNFRRTPGLGGNSDGVTTISMNNNEGQGQIIRGEREVPVLFGTGTNTTTGDPEEFWVYRDEPYVCEACIDQGDLEVSGTGKFRVSAACETDGEIWYGEKDDAELYQTDGPVKAIGRTNFPGQVTGLNIPFDLHWLAQDVYQQSGWSRVAICDKPNYFDSAKRVHLIPKSWTNGKLEYELRDGWWDCADFVGKHICIIGPDDTQVASVEITS